MLKIYGLCRIIKVYMVLYKTFCCVKQRDYLKYTCRVLQLIFSRPAVTRNNLNRGKIQESIDFSVKRKYNNIIKHGLLSQGG